MKIYEDVKFLANEEAIKEYFEEAAYDELDCGQGYATDEGEAFAKIGDRYYLVKFKAEIESAKQDRGDRLYWVDKIKSVTWNEIGKTEVFSFLNREILGKIDALKNKIIELESSLYKLT